MIHSHSSPQTHKVGEKREVGMDHRTPLSFLMSTGMSFFTCLHFLANLICVPPLAACPSPRPRAFPFPFSLCGSLSAPSSFGSLDLQPAPSMPLRCPPIWSVRLLPARQRPGLTVLTAVRQGCEVHMATGIGFGCAVFCCPGFGGGNWRHRGRGTGSDVVDAMAEAGRVPPSWGADPWG